jgi:hypothetical protein
VLGGGGGGIDILQFRLLFGIFFSTIYGPCSVWIAWQRRPPMKGELWWRGVNSISKFDHHNIHGGAVANTVHDVTGRRLVSSIYSWDIYGWGRRQKCRWTNPPSSSCHGASCPFHSQPCGKFDKLIEKCSDVNKSKKGRAIWIMFGNFNFTLITAVVHDALIT